MIKTLRTTGRLLCKEYIVYKIWDFNNPKGKPVLETTDEAVFNLYRNYGVMVGEELKLDMPRILAEMGKGATIELSYKNDDNHKTGSFGTAYKPEHEPRYVGEIIPEVLTNIETLAQDRFMQWCKELEDECALEIPKHVLAEYYNFGYAPKQAYKQMCRDGLFDQPEANKS